MLFTFYLAAFAAESLAGAAAIAGPAATAGNAWE